jgi:hypothetical protein
VTLAAATAPARVRARVGAAVPAALLGAGVAPVLAANGGYYPTSWGWTGSALAWGAVIVAAFREQTRPSRYELAFLGGLLAFVGWLVISMAWTETQTGTPLEIERTLVYVAAALALLAIGARDQVAPLLGGICAGATAVCAYSLSTRLFPEQFVGASVTTGTQISGQRLAVPIGYWNGLGLTAAISLLLALGFAARATTRGGRLAAGVAVPLLLTTLYFSFSRGAALALALGVVVLILTDRRRLQFVFATAPLVLIGAVLVWRSSRYYALTHLHVTLAAASHAGHHLAAIVLVCLVVGGLVGLGVHAVENRRSMPAAVYTAAPWVTAAGIVLALVLIFVRFGAPWTIARHGYDSFTSPIAKTGNLNSHLLTFANNGHLAAWKVAWHAFEAHPVGGIGAGGYAQYWNQHRVVPLKLQDAHSLYLETMAETGIVGLLLLLTALLAPVAAFRRARASTPLAAAALAAYAAYLFDAGLDWHWELSGVTLTGLLVAGGVLFGARNGEPAGRYRLLPLALGSAVALAALFGLLGNLKISAADRASASGNLADAAAKAHDATRWVPWSATPWDQLGWAQLDLGQVRLAQASFRTAVSKDPGNESLWLDLAEASSGRAQAAALARAQALNPLDRSPWYLGKQLGGHPAFWAGKG